MNCREFSLKTSCQYEFSVFFAYKLFIEDNDIFIFNMKFLSSAQYTVHLA